jgi:hypothetical protein
MARHFFTFALILLAAFSRLLPHPPNVVPITALALFGGVYLEKKHTFIVPIAAMLISDYFIGFHSGMTWVYASFIAIGFMGLWLRRHRSIAATFGATLAGSLLFYVVTNFGVWIGSSVYPHNIEGLVGCYVAAIPFFRNTILGDVLYVTVLLGTYEMLSMVIPSLKVDVHSAPR